MGKKGLTYFSKNLLYTPELALKNGLGHINIPLPFFLLLPIFSAFLPVFAVKVQKINLDFFLMTQEFMS
jgi:hypothetical protein